MAKYFSITVDSKQDITHVDQLTAVIQYVSSEGPVKRFLKFIPMFSSAEAEAVKIVFQFLNMHGINSEGCRDQSCDNAANMSAKYDGLQTLILD